VIAAAVGGVNRERRQPSPRRAARIIVASTSARRGKSSKLAEQEAGRESGLYDIIYERASTT